MANPSPLPPIWLALGENLLWLGELYNQITFLRGLAITAQQC